MTHLVRPWLGILLLAIFFGASLIGSREFSKAGDTKMVIRIGFRKKAFVPNYDPARIQVDTEAVVLDNLYSPLVRFDREGRIEPALAERFSWDGRDVRFWIRENARTVDGVPISADDAAFSLKRLLVDRANAHGDLQTFLCPNEKLISIGDECDGIRVEEQGRLLRLTVAREEYRPFLIQMLANMDFGVIPRNSCDDSQPMPRIVDYRNTSGPYYLEEQREPGSFTLRVNPHHWLAGSGIPKVLEFVPALPSEALELLQAGKIDFIPTIHTYPSEELQQARASRLHVSFDTLPIRKLSISTTRDKLGRFTDLERHAIYQRVRKEFFREFPNIGWQPSTEFFPAYGEGGLDSNQRSTMEKRLREADSVKIEKTFTVGVYGSQRAMYEKVFSRLPQARLVEVTQLSPFMKPEDRPDFYISMTDTGFYETINLISYSIFDGSLDLTPEEGRVWLSSYMLEPDKEKRLERLRELHFRSLMKGMMGIIGEAPYTAVARKGCRYEGSRFFAGSPLWQIRCD